MTQHPEDIRTDIEQTRTTLGHDVDALAEKVDPTKAVERQKDRLRDRMRNASQAVMGTPDAGQRAQDMAHQAGDAVQDIPHKVTSGTRGNPLAAGLMAFGAGALAASLVPSSRAEQDVATRVKDRAQPLVDEAKVAAQQAGEQLKPQAQQAAQAVKDTAAQGAQRVKTQGQGHARELKDDSKQAARHVQASANKS